MSRHPKGCAGPKQPKQKVRGEGATWAACLDKDGSPAVRCKTCGSNVKLSNWWEHRCGSATTRVDAPGPACPAS